MNALGNNIDCKTLRQSSQNFPPVFQSIFGVRRKKAEENSFFASKTTDQHVATNDFTLFGVIL
jgi:hypothetical protein